MASKFFYVTNLCHSINRAWQPAAEPISSGCAGSAKQILFSNKIIFFLTLKVGTNKEYEKLIYKYL